MLDYIFLCIKNQQIFKSGIDSKVCLMKIYKLQVTILAFGKILYGLACLYILNIKKFVLFFRLIYEKFAHQTGQIFVHELTTNYMDFRNHHTVNEQKVVQNHCILTMN